MNSDGVWSKFKVWAGRPFSVDMTAGEWFLFIGLLIVIIGLWNIILFRITDLVRSG
jgi:hypothetical protein